LSMVYGIISQSDGFIAVNSHSDYGTRFDIYLPLTAEKISTSAREPEEPASIPPGSGTILVVEDNDIVRKVTCEILRNGGYQVIEANDGKMALRVFADYAGQIDLLLTDVVMPVMKGPELARRLLQVDPSLRVVLMSGYNDESMSRDDARSSWPMIRKPFSPVSLSREIHAMLNSESSQRGE